VLTCLANDIGYDNIFAEQLRVLAGPNDILIALSGSGNSPNILKALEQANSLRMKNFAILGYSGGKAKALASTALHIPVDDMQIAEDMQLIIGHMLMQWLCALPIKLSAQVA
jgi:D-sedoheptulose 7-phosphate isomerase